MPYDRNDVRRAYDRIADEYLAERSEDDDSEDLALLEEFYMHLPEDARVLDAGCGAGRPIAQLLAGDVDLVGIDFSREQIARARKNVPEGRFCQADMTELGFGDGTFDGICAYHSIIHVPSGNHPDVAREFRRLLRPGGHLLLTIGSEAWEGSNDDWLGTGVEMHWSIPSPDESERILEESGFEIRWRHTVNDEMGGTATFVLARRTESEETK
ncbi:MULTISPECIES: class I SAM-dependent methyltransferase [unclassified Haladaptatus]|uniref:class I SAM-dependent methyltransferase n=1 Tax=unclassified Haladaptatus TaxID=2622732 RepID=UPI00209BDE75|nr:MULTISPECIES: class I SAM-dependent methyltransferase [unclassified Haladaptatus]MCO8243137.1 class I SAM-dependent methyltransferase [Haladaptatus sp. AB643]MCO8252849.1 class I SAM-dependent methyltransferase [Haladaptatus sp. AB618]